MGKFSRNKGKRGERMIAAKFREIYGDRVRRGWQSRQGDDEADIEDAGPWWLEVKYYSSGVSIMNALRQAEEDLQNRPEDPRIPVAVCKNTKAAHRTPWTIGMRLNAFLEFCKQLVEAPEKIGQCVILGETNSAVTQWVEKNKSHCCNVFFGADASTGTITVMPNASDSGVFDWFVVLGGVERYSGQSNALESAKTDAILSIRFDDDA